MRIASAMVAPRVTDAGLAVCVAENGGGVGGLRMAKFIFDRRKVGEATIAGAGFNESKL
jgi:predicted NAD/FAD-dependent oxidoreductase